jgi:hypothetical protein
VKRSPLRRRTPLRRTQWIRRPTREQRGWAKAVREVRERSGDRCEIRSPLCTHVGTQTHHVLNRSQGGKADPALLRRTCAPCHTYLGNHVAEAYERGWLIKSWEAK